MIKRIASKILSQADSRIMPIQKPAPHTFNYSGQGFTVIELVVILAIVAILAAVAILNIPEWRDNTQLKTTASPHIS